MEAGLPKREAISLMEDSIGHEDLPFSPDSDDATKKDNG